MQAHPPPGSLSERDRRLQEREEQWSRRRSSVSALQPGVNTASLEQREQQRDEFQRAVEEDRRQPLPTVSRPPSQGERRGWSGLADGYSDAGGVPPISGARGEGVGQVLDQHTAVKSRRDQVYDEKRKQFLERRASQQGQGLPPSNKSIHQEREGVFQQQPSNQFVPPQTRAQQQYQHQQQVPRSDPVAPFVSRINEANIEVVKERRQPEYAEQLPARVEVSTVEAGPWSGGAGSTAVTEAEKRRKQHEYAAQLQQQMAAEAPVSRAPRTPTRSNEVSSIDAGAWSGGAGSNGDPEAEKRRKQREYALALQQQMSAGKSDPLVGQRRDVPATTSETAWAGDRAVPEASAEKKRRQREYAEQLQQQQASRSNVGQRSEHTAPDATAPGPWAGDSKTADVEAERKRKQREYAQQLEQQMSAGKVDVRDEVAGFGAVGTAPPPWAADRVNSADVEAERRKKQKEYADQLQQQVVRSKAAPQEPPSVHTPRGVYEVLPVGAGPKVVDQEAEKKRRQREYAEQLRLDMESAAKKDTLGKPVGSTDGRDAGGRQDAEVARQQNEVADKRRRQHEYAAQLQHQQQLQQISAQMEAAKIGTQPPQGRQPQTYNNNNPAGGMAIGSKSADPEAEKRRRQREYADQLRQQMNAPKVDSLGRPVDTSANDRNTGGMYNNNVNSAVDVNGGFDYGRDRQRQLQDRAAEMADRADSDYQRALEQQQMQYQQQQSYQQQPSQNLQNNSYPSQSFPPQYSQQYEPQQRQGQQYMGHDQQPHTQQQQYQPPYSNNSQQNQQQSVPNNMMPQQPNQYGYGQHAPPVRWNNVPEPSIPQAPQPQLPTASARHMHNPITPQQAEAERQRRDLYRRDLEAQMAVQKEKERAKKEERFGPGERSGGPGGADRGWQQYNTHANNMNNVHRPNDSQYEDPNSRSNQVAAYQKRLERDAEEKASIAAAVAADKHAHRGGVSLQPPPGYELGPLGTFVRKDVHAGNRSQQKAYHENANQQKSGPAPDTDLWSSNGSQHGFSGGGIGSDSKNDPQQWGKQQQTYGNEREKDREGPVKNLFADQQLEELLGHDGVDIKKELQRRLAQELAEQVEDQKRRKAEKKRELIEEERKENERIEQERVLIQKRYEESEKERKRLEAEKEIKQAQDMKKAAEAARLADAKRREEEDIKASAKAEREHLELQEKYRLEMERERDARVRPPPIAPFVSPPESVDNEAFNIKAPLTNGSNTVKDQSLAGGVWSRLGDQIPSPTNQQNLINSNVHTHIGSNNASKVQLGHSSSSATSGLPFFDTNEQQLPVRDGLIGGKVLPIPRLQGGTVPPAAASSVYRPQGGDDAFRRLQQQVNEQRDTVNMLRADLRANQMNNNQPSAYRAPPQLLSSVWQLPPPPPSVPAEDRVAPGNRNNLRADDANLPEYLQLLRVASQKLRGALSEDNDMESVIQKSPTRKGEKNPLWWGGTGASDSSSDGSGDGLQPADAHRSRNVLRYPHGKTPGKGRGIFEGIGRKRPNTGASTATDSTTQSTARSIDGKTKLVYPSKLRANGNVESGRGDAPSRFEDNVGEEEPEEDDSLAEAWRALDTARSKVAQATSAVEVAMSPSPKRIDKTNNNRKSNNSPSEHEHKHRYEKPPRPQQMTSHDYIQSQQQRRSSSAQSLESVPDSSRRSSLASAGLQVLSARSYADVDRHTHTHDGRKKLHQQHTRGMETHDNSSDEEVNNSRPETADSTASSLNVQAIRRRLKETEARLAELENDNEGDDSSENDPLGTARSKKWKPRRKKQDHVVGEKIRSGRGGVAHMPGSEDSDDDALDGLVLHHASKRPVSQGSERSIAGTTRWAVRG